MKGSIQVKKTVGGGYAEDGTPVAVSSVYSEPIPCMIVPNTKGLLRKYADGESVVASYEIILKAVKNSVFIAEDVHLVDSNDGQVVVIEQFNPNTIKVKDDRNRDLGEYKVLPMNIRYLDSVQRILILI